VESSLPGIRGSYRFDVELAKTSWFGVGGRAEVVFRPADLDDLIFFLQKKDPKLPITILGATSNVIISDKGIKGVLIKLGGVFAKISSDKENIRIGAGALCKNISEYSQDNSLGGLEFLTGIPGTMGGAIAMNAGCFDSEISKILLSVKAVDFKGNILNFSNEQCQFSYRQNNLPKNLIFIEGVFKSYSRKSDDIAALIVKYNKYRVSSQPIRKKTGGSTFKNPLNQKSWQLIDSAGCRGLKVGDAKISEKHCNFMINNGNATARDLVELGNIVQERVKKNSGVSLQWEIKFIQ